ncbi:uncharacterized protein BDW43DRAFT_295772 [Aspergillus alliaceus]|uniref:uncharacterized protein n=1 Tax=Petromyces alliaceus TaxID=209559 RepID=UPI0012A499CE|nr:uncharacterized protein BDW43DRAFT_295772 [Aspergillus alliaceus]KAB8226787.1 hypothetical protein BDW43DRAFT_295772 [Aspergillus alliaceus]
MARDFLSVAVSGVGVESLFNTSRDICHYRRSRLDPKTIHGLMILLMADRFQLREDCRIEKEEGDNISDIYNYLEQPGDKDHFEYISDSDDSGDPEENLFDLLDEDHVEDEDTPEIPDIQPSTPIEKEHAQFHEDDSEDDIRGPETLGHRRQSRYGARAVNYRALAGYRTYNTQH